MHEPMSPQRERIVRREMADPTYGGTWHIRENETGERTVWEVTHQGTVLATMPDWAGNLAMWIADARDDVPQLLAEVDRLRTELDKYVGHEPTVAEEMAYLNRCLNAVHDLCREAEKQATRWEQPLPVPEWVDAVRKAAGGESPVEDEVVNLRAMLADREREIAELKAAEPTLDDDQPAAPR